MRKRHLSVFAVVGALLTSGVVNAEAEPGPLRAALTLAPIEKPAPQKPVDPAARELAQITKALDEALGETPLWVGDDGELISVDRVRRYLERKGSPLAPYAADFVAAGVANDVDPRAVISIAAIESSFGKRQRGNNAWGWSGGPGGSLSRWPDWPTAIHDYTAKLGSKYDVTNIDTAFAKRYVPPNWEHWLKVVHAVWREI